MSDADIRRDAEIRGLLAEREGYARRGLTGRVKDVDAELKLRGYSRAAKRGKERAVVTPTETG